MQIYSVSLIFPPRNDILATGDFDEIYFTFGSRSDYNIRAELFDHGAHQKKAEEKAADGAPYFD